MISNLVPKRGIPVLAYSVPSSASLPWPCTLVIKYSRDYMQATIALKFSIPVHGFDHDATFTLVYNADNLVPATTSVVPATMIPPQAQTERMARQGNPQLQTLSLALKNRCPIFCSTQHVGNVMPRPGFDAQFQQLVKLAGATQIHILFDYKWIHQHNQGPFHEFISHPERLAGIPVDRLLVDQTRAKLHWTEDCLAFASSEGVSEAPPSYTEALKRPRAPASSSPELPSTKRALLSPPPFALSPTEKATSPEAATASTSSPKPSSSPKPPSSPFTNSFEFQNAVQAAVERLLPNALQTALPDMLPRMFVPPSSSPSPLMSSLSPRTSHTQSLRSLRILINSQLATHVEAHLQRIYDDALDHSASMHNAANAEFHEVLDEQKFDITMVKDDGIDELNRLVGDKLHELKDEVAEIVGEVGEYAERVCVDTCKKLDALIDRERDILWRERDILEREKRNFEVEKLLLPRANALRVRRRRVVSL